MSKMFGVDAAWTNWKAKHKIEARRTFFMVSGCYRLDGLNPRPGYRKMTPATFIKITLKPFEHRDILLVEPTNDQTRQPPKPRLPTTDI